MGHYFLDTQYVQISSFAFQKINVEILFIWVFSESEIDEQFFFVKYDLI